MKRTIALIAATAMAFSPAAAFGQTAPGQGQFHGTNYWHSNSGKATGQPAGRLLDGRYRERVRPYASLVMDEPEVLA